MGNGCSVNGDPEVGTNSQINRNLKRERDSDSLSTVRLVLFGAGGAGKSTIFKQAKVVYKNGFSKEDVTRYRNPIHANCIEIIQTMAAYLRKEHADLYTEDLKASLKLMCELDQFAELEKVHADCILLLWKTPAFRLAYEERAKYQLIDNAEYFVDNILRICSKTYIPTEEDIIRSRVRTSGIVETSVEMQGIKFEFIDVGGQRGERRKWIHLFENIRAVLYVSGISEYDQVCLEDANQNRLTESIQLFRDICKKLPKVTIILLLNKHDLFEKKFEQRQSSLSTLFPDYKGGWDKNLGIEFIQNKFLEQDPSSKSRDLYLHTISAVDTNVMRKVFNSIRDCVVQKNLELVNFA